MVMAVLMLGTAFGRTLDIHYCGDEIQNVNLFGKAQTCEKMASSDNENEKDTHKCCHHSEDLKQHNPDTPVLKENCCHNESFSVALSGDEPIQLYLFGKLLTTSAVILFEPIFSNKCHIPKPAYFSPPPPKLKALSHQIVYQTFLI